MKRAALYMRVSTLDQHPETQLYDLLQMAQQRGYRIEEYTDRISGAQSEASWARCHNAGWPLRSVRRLLVWASDRIARSVKHFLEVLDELNRLNIEFISFREQIDTGGLLGRAVVVIIGAIAELERNLIIERYGPECAAPNSKAGTSDASRWLSIKTPSCGDRQQGQSLGQLAKGHLVSRATIHRVLRDQTHLEKSA